MLLMKEQILFRVGSFLSIPVLPIMLWQGKRIRKEIPSLPEAQGATQGIIDRGAKTIKLLTLGESTIAGVGVSNHEEGITGQMAQALAKQTNATVHWQVIAKSGFTVKKVTQELVPLVPDIPQDIIVVGMGGNDTFTINSPAQWRKDFIALIKAIRTKQPSCPIVIANMPPIGEFPAFTKLIQMTLGNLVKLHGTAIEDFPHVFPNLYYNNSLIQLKDWADKLPANNTAKDFFSDGVHPSKLTYQLWGEDMVQFIMDKKIFN